jgi:6,7-dimethyl-8-ribityllumazine synthase
MTFGVLTTNTADEAMARAAEGPSNKGREAAEAALALAGLFAALDVAGDPQAART